MMTWKIRRGYEAHLYAGADPSGTGTVRLTLGSMTQEQLAGWLRGDPATARRYVLGPDPDRVPPPKRDNTPDLPPPVAPELKPASKAKKKKE